MLQFFKVSGRHFRQEDLQIHHPPQAGVDLPAGNYDKLMTCNILTFLNSFSNLKLSVMSKPFTFFLL